MMGTGCKAGRCGPGSRMIAEMLPGDHLLRRIDRLLDKAELRGALVRHYSPRGRPSVDPKLLIRMALIGRIYAITSERRLCEELRYNLAYRWFCRLPVAAAVPHHSTFSKNRHGRFHNAGVFRLLFENTVRRCIAAGLVSAKDAALDASFVAADASWQRKMRAGDLARSFGAAALPRPVREWLVDEATAPDPDVGPRRSAPAALSCTGPAAAWSARTVRGRFGYALNILMDAPSGAALDVEATPRLLCVRGGARGGAFQALVRACHPVPWPAVWLDRFGSGECGLRARRRKSWPRRSSFSCRLEASLGNCWRLADRHLACDVP